MQVHVQDMLANILVNEKRNLNYRFMVAEWLWIYFGDNSVDTIARYNSQMRKFSDDERTLTGAYGPRVSFQYEYIRQALKKDRDTRQAVMTIFSPTPAPSKDIPCTISLQFFIRQHVLHLTANMRSSDIWLGLPYDVFSFTMIANALTWFDPLIRLGSLTLNLGSSHLYETNLEEAQKIVYEPDEGLRSPRLLHEIPTELYGVLEDPEFDPSLQWPFYRYANVLRAKTRIEAIAELIKLVPEVSNT